ncbi:MAG: hypothetical protein A7316_08765 [Candidatus Altiarchaeales archaeon WOR_SM1_86-2]|nr:MAG: hypothetical protein A7316_08765 [Candidatus Altiarchaeales archaeon WOR_SM1_86-2]ODS40832.1 MAG: hypothetical protein A7315_07555 [Candidatus Altiarchaeales archaeon WOR_SM1_79]
MADIKYYTPRDWNKDAYHAFGGMTPRQAALKAATRGFREIQLMERRKNDDGMWRVHVFEGSVKKVPKPPNAPDWMAGRINKSNVKKIRMDKIKKL